MNRSYFAKFIVLTSILIGVSCTSTAVIDSDPSGADVYINGMKMGKTPYTYSDTKVLFSKQQLMLKKKGYETVNGFIARDEANAGLLVLGLLCFWPTLLWAWEYRPNYTFVMDKKSSRAGMIGTMTVAGLSALDFPFPLSHEAATEAVL